MISQKYRFHSRGGIKYVYNHGENIRGGRLSLIYIANSKRRTSRFAVIISKKVLKSAVGRNRIRRRVYEVIRDEIPKMTASHDVLMTIYDSELKDISYKELTEMIREVFREAKLYNKSDIISGEK